jgi:energy-coupling factor transport system ATP-binding protein
MERVEDEVAFGLENRAWPLERMRARVPEALREIGLRGSERRRSTSLSGGEQQRLALAGVLAPAPPILVLDEPTANLDPDEAGHFLERLHELRSAGMTIVLIEHRAELAWPLADELLVLRSDGRQLDAGPVGAVVERQGEALLGAGVWLPSAIESRLTGQQPPATTGTPGLVPLPASSPLLSARSLSFAYDGRPAVADVDLEVAGGERICLVGRNGSGKSTLGRLLVGLLRPAAGKVRLAGREPFRLAPVALARLCGYGFQDPEQQFFRGTVAEEVRAGLEPGEAERVEPLMAALGLPLERFGERSPYRLSGGEQRRVSLAAILLRRPSLLVLDEPTFGQDRRSYEALLALLRDQVETGTAIVAATHDPRLAADLAERIVVLRGGALAADEPTERFLRDGAARLAAGWSSADVRRLPGSDRP